ncbi:MAG: S8 family peptidase, partial [Candidatus Falkowbacteria bacterium]|nr:S8 family peptidase [Candidatus Falkowbacteria bacterium]
MKLEVFILSLQFFTSLFFVGINSANAVVPSDTFFDEQWYLKKIKAIEAWDITRDSPNIVIAIIDSGVEIDNPDLKDNVWRNVKEAPDNGIDDDKNGYVDDVNGWDFVNNSNNPRPKFNKGFTEAGVLHGTIVAGIAAASGNNASGIAGVTWRAQIMPLKVLDDTGEGRTDKVIEAINYAIKNGADIINLSFVGFNDSKNLELTIKRAYDAGIIIVAAAGNEQNQGDGYFLDKTPMYPVCNDGPNGENWVLGVVATDALDEKASFSSYGFKCTDIAAPGVSIFSTSINNPAKSFEGNPFDKNFEGYWAGTSMAVPMISGTIALIEATNPSLSRQGIYQALLDRSDNISLLNQQYLGRLGKGRLNVLESVKYASQVLRDKKEKIIITGEKSEGASVREFYLNGEFDQEFPVFDKSIKGASIATCDLDHDGISEIIAGAKAGGAPLIKIFNHNGEIRKQFLAFANNFKLGVNVACGDLNNDGFSEIVVSANGGGQ